MTVRRINLVLQSLAIALLLAGLGALVAGLLMPLESPAPATESSLKHAGAPPATQPIGLPPLEQFAQVWAHPLRQPLADAGPQAAAPPPAPANPNPAFPGVSSAPPPMTLVGTVGDSVALLQSSDGSVSVCSVGQSLGGMEVVAVRNGHVDLRFNGRLLSLDKAPDATVDTFIHPAGDVAPQP